MLDMAKKPPSHSQTESMRIAKTLAKKLRLLATHLDTSMPELVSKLLEPIVDEMIGRMLQEMTVGMGKKKSDK